jgi:hypothetical protein
MMAPDVVVDTLDGLCGFVLFLVASGLLTLAAVV